MTTRWTLVSPVPQLLFKSRITTAIKKLPNTQIIKYIDSIHLLTWWTYHLQIQMDHVVLMKKCYTLQDLLHQPLHIFLLKGLVPLRHTVTEDLSTSSTRSANIKPNSLHLLHAKREIFTVLRQVWTFTSVGHMGSGHLFFMCTVIGHTREKGELAEMSLSPLPLFNFSVHQVHDSIIMTGIDTGSKSMCMRTHTVQQDSREIIDTG